MYSIFVQPMRILAPCGTSTGGIKFGDYHDLLGCSIIFLHLWLEFIAFGS